MLSINTVLPFHNEVNLNYYLHLKSSIFFSIKLMYSTMNCNDAISFSNTNCPPLSNYLILEKSVLDIFHKQYRKMVKI